MNCTIAKFLLKLFSKSLRNTAAEPWSLVATSEITTGFSFWLEQERAQWAMKRVRSTKKTRSVECDLAFKATMFLTVSLCQKKKLYRRSIFFNYGSGRPMVAPTGLIVTFIFACRGGYYPPAIYKNIIAFCAGSRGRLPLRVCPRLIFLIVGAIHESPLDRRGRRSLQV